MKNHGFLVFQKLRVQMVSPSKYFSSFDIDMYAVPLMGTDFRRESISLFHSHPVFVVSRTFFIVADLFHPWEIWTVPLLELYIAT